MQKRVRSSVATRVASKSTPTAATVKSAKNLPAEAADVTPEEAKDLYKCVSVPCHRGGCRGRRLRCGRRGKDEERGLARCFTLAAPSSRPQGHVHGA